MSMRDGDGAGIRFFWHLLSAGRAAAFDGTGQGRTAVSGIDDPADSLPYCLDAKQVGAILHENGSDRCRDRKTGWQPWD